MKKIYQFLLVLFLCFGLANVKANAAPITFEDQFGEDAYAVAFLLGADPSDEITQEMIDTTTNITGYLPPNTYYTPNRNLSDLDGFEIFTNLETLSLENYKLTNFPYNLSSLPNLKNLSLIGSNISLNSLDAQLSDFKTLESFNFSNLTYSGNGEFPQEIKTIPNLKSLTLENCDLRSVTKEDELFLRNLDFTSLKNQYIQSGGSSRRLGEDYIASNGILPGLPILKQSTQYSIPLDITYTLQTPDGTVSLPAPLDFNEDGNVVIDQSLLPTIGEYKATFSVRDTTGLFDDSTYSISFDIIPVYITLSLRGDETMTIQQGDTFVDPGVLSSDYYGKVPVVATGEVDTSTPGTYILTYTATNIYETQSITRTVVVEAIENPITLTLNGTTKMELNVGDTFSDPGAIASDNDRNLAVSVSGSVDTSKPGTYIITYSATNAFETQTITREVIVNAIEIIDNPITLNLNGSSTMELSVDDTFSDPGAIASDNDGNLAVSASGNVDTTKPGIYILTYTATNAYETKSITRTVIVKEKASAETPLTPTPSNTSPTTPANPIKKPSIAGTTSTTNTTTSPATGDTHTTPWGFVMMISGITAVYFVSKKYLMK